MFGENFREFLDRLEGNLEKTIGDILDFKEHQTNFRINF